MDDAIGLIGWIGEEGLKAVVGQIGVQGFAALARWGARLRFARDGTSQSVREALTAADEGGPGSTALLQSKLDAADRAFWDDLQAVVIRAIKEAREEEIAELMAQLPESARREVTARNYAPGGTVHDQSVNAGDGGIAVGCQQGQNVINAPGSTFHFHQGASPGSDRVVFHVPAPPPHFVGREVELRRLERELAPGRRVALKQTLHGGGGIGKTSLAAKFCEVYGGRFAGVFWLSAETEATLRDDLALLGLTHGRAALEEGKEVQVEKGLAVVSRTAPSLVVLDNLGEWETVGPRLRALPGAAILATTRQGDLAAAVGGGQEVEVLPLEEAVELLLASAQVGAPTDAERRAAADLAQTLGRLPLVLEQAGFFCRSSRRTIPQLAEDWKSLAEAVLKRSPKPAGQHEALWVMVESSFDELEEESPAAAMMAGILAWLDPDFNAVDVFEALAPLWPSPLGEALAEVGSLYDSLRNSGLVKEVTAEIVQPEGPERVQGWAIHRCFAEALRLGRGSALGAVAWRVLEGLWSEDLIHRKDRWGLYGRILSSTMTLSRRLLPHQKGDLQAGIACYLLEIQPDPFRAMQVSEEGLSLDLAAFGRSNPQVARDLNNFGSALFALGRLEEALAAYRDAEYIDRATLGGSHPNVAKYLSNIGCVLKELGRLDQAAAALQEALKIYRLRCNPLDSDVARTLNNLGSVLQDNGVLDEALNHFNEAEIIFRQARGNDHPSVATAINNTGTVLQQKGLLLGALRQFKEAARIDREALGKDHPNLARDLRNLGSVLNQLGDYEEALSAIGEALRIDKNIFGESHLFVARDTNQLGRVRFWMGELDWAKAHFDEAYRIALKANGPKVPILAVLASDLVQAGGDPVAVAREVGGDSLAGEIEKTLGERLTEEHPHL